MMRPKTAVYLKCHSRVKDGKEHRYYTIAERVACMGGRRVERHVFYLGEINDSQREAWIKCIEVFDAQEDKRQFGYSRDKRSDCVQVVIALVVTPEGFPLAYEVLSGNTSDKTTLKSFLERIEKQYGKARRIWVMDRGIPAEEVLREMGQSDPPIQYVVGTPKGRLSALEESLLKLRWQEARPSVKVKLLVQEQELYVLVNSQARRSKERAIRRRKLKTLWNRLKELKEQRPSYPVLLMKLGAAKEAAGRVWSLVEIQLPEAPRTKKARQQRIVNFEFTLQKDKLRDVLKREGRYRGSHACPVRSL
jgi:hypothetical protein